MLCTSEEAEPVNFHTFDLAYLKKFISSFVCICFGQFKGTLSLFCDTLRTNVRNFLGLVSLR